MKLYADLHVHSKYARACSPELTPTNLALWGKRKGIQILGTGDFTHPAWQVDLDTELEEQLPGLYGIKEQQGGPYFLYQTEIASIYKKDDKLRRVHNLIFAPSRETSKKIIAELEKLGCNLRSDGRPITGVHNEDLVKLVKDVDAESELVPAHIWTPHFGAFGSLSGFDSLAGGYGEESKYIWAIETGISSDPDMNWRVSELNSRTLISNSDLHSLRRLGREANCLSIEEDQLSYSSVMDALKNKDSKGMLYTVEFFPEEGRYHFDGHRDCKFSCEPARTSKLKEICPVCGKKLLRGALSRVEALTDQSPGAVSTRVPYKKTLQLEEIIAASLGVGVQSKKVQSIYLTATDQRAEFELLFDASEEVLEKALGRATAEGVMYSRAGKVSVEPGYDGVYGKVTLFSPKELDLFSAEL